MPDLHTLTLPEEPSDALAAVVALRAMADQLERKAVRQAIEDGWTWAQVAEALGVSRQAAHKKHAGSLARD
ncbi:helix-turn-helix domain-containing protein [Pseudoduganella sp. UC29_71]|jgi:transcriptional regulator with GAF, ATPase, and Fis domain|uniref:helix-turn-helix domain-containing protein n=1 Tax=Pseudoduganella sp. UC29_71 TaxID=3350174 RepID=UPI000D3069E1